MGEGACPFNYLYWDFLDRHRDKLGENPRLAFPYRNLDKMKDAQIDAFRRDAAAFRRQLKA